ARSRHAENKCTTGTPSTFPDALAPVLSGNVLGMPQLRHPVEFWNRADRCAVLISAIKIFDRPRMKASRIATKADYDGALQGHEAATEEMSSPTRDEAKVMGWRKITTCAGSP
ncbi:hypothetical protein THAOC_21854, partial [Thalassiosira oceanica]